MAVCLFIWIEIKFSKAGDLYSEEGGVRACVSPPAYKSSEVEILLKFGGF